MKWNRSLVSRRMNLLNDIWSLSCFLACANTTLPYVMIGTYDVYNQNLFFNDSLKRAFSKINNVSDLTLRLATRFRTVSMCRRLDNRRVWRLHTWSACGPSDRLIKYQTICLICRISSKRTKLSRFLRNNAAWVFKGMARILHFLAPRSSATVWWFETVDYWPKYWLIGRCFIMEPAVKILRDLIRSHRHLSNQLKISWR